jgi:hypothetical protein
MRDYDIKTSSVEGYSASLIAPRTLQLWEGCELIIGIEGLKLIGLPIGKQAFKQGFLDQEVSKLQQKTDNIMNRLRSTQQQQLLLRNCAVTSFGFAAASVGPTPETAVMVARGEISLLLATPSIAGFDVTGDHLPPEFNERVKMQIGLPVRNGG